MRAIGWIDELLSIGAVLQGRNFSYPLSNTRKMDRIVIIEYPYFVGLGMSLKDFQIIEKLGEGAYSTVYRVKRLIDNQEYAMKKVKMNNLS